jgi:O-antigen/teichoic acid export membrane protein
MNAVSKSDRPLRGAFVASVATAGGLALFGFASSALAARLLQPEQRGTLAAIQVVPGFLALLGMIGQTEAITYFAARGDLPLGDIQGTGLRIAGLGCIGAMAIGAIVVPLILSGRPNSVVIAGVVYLLICPALAGLTVGPAWFRARGRTVVWNATRLIAPVAWTVVVVLAWLRHDRSPTRLAITFVVVLVSLSVPIVVLSVRAIHDGPVRYRSALRGPILRYGLPAMATAAPQLLNLRLDQTVMATFLPNKELGYYVTAVGWSTSISLLLNGFGFVLLPAVAKERDPETQRLVFRTLVRRGAIFSVALVVVVLVITPTVFPSRFVFSSSYRPAVPAAMVLVVAAGVLGFNQILSEAVRGLARPGLVLRCELGGLVVTVICLAAFLGPFGIVGAAWSSLIGYSSVTAQLLVVARFKNHESGGLSRPGEAPVHGQ